METTRGFDPKLRGSELKDKLKFYRISSEEYKKIKHLLGRSPQGVEWAIFSALWSEHCSYKSSKVHLKKLFFPSPRVLQSFGENAGLVDLGQGERVAFKMESHNHPSFMEPYQGAATGVGGILRDIFTMGARPVALANYLCFGQPEAPRMESLVKGVVGGIGGYGNCVGVATVTGQTHFHESYNGNILVNALALGLFTEKDPICLSQAQGVGNLVIYVGARTGRDGVHGASMSSESFENNSEDKKHHVQIGDPFYGRLLIESCLEAMAQGLVVAIQDMGAAGLISSSFEMAEKGGVGLSLDLDQVPLRDKTMGAEEILLSESQERMLLICSPENFPALEKIFSKWGLVARSIGEVVEKPVVSLSFAGEILTELSPDRVVGQAPQYERPYDPWVVKSTPGFKNKTVTCANPTLRLKQILAHPNGCAREWIYEQYDQGVGASTVLGCSHPIGVVALPSGRALGLVLGGRNHILRQDPHVGGVDSIVEPFLQLVLRGFEPLAVTDCLNFGNPERREVMTDFVACLEGMGRACRAFEVPIVSGNVSFYNESSGQGISPSPSTGLVGLRGSMKNIPGSQFQENQVGDLIYLISLGLSKTMGLQSDTFQEENFMEFDEHLPTLFKKSKQLKILMDQGGVGSGRWVTNYGLAYALARMSVHVGATVEWEGECFTESFYQAVVTVSKDQEDLWVEGLKSTQLEAYPIGVVGGECLKWKDLDLTTNEIKEIYYGSWKGAFPGLQ